MFFFSFSREDTTQIQIVQYKMQKTTCSCIQNSKVPKSFTDTQFEKKGFIDRAYILCSCTKMKYPSLRDLVGSAP